MAKINNKTTVSNTSNILGGGSGSVWGPIGASGTIQIAPNTGIGGITTFPYSSGTSYPLYPTGTITYSTNNSIFNQHSYVLFKLPIKEIPELFYINGRAVTLGMFGSKAQAVFVNKHLLINRIMEFYSAGVNSHWYFVLQFKDRVVNYCAEGDFSNGFGIKLIENSRIIDTELLSEIKR